MAGLIGQGVTLNGYYDEESVHTFIITGTVTANDVGKAVTLDTTQANSVKLAGDGDPIFGKMMQFEDRSVEGIKVAAVCRRFSAPLPIKTGATVNIGDTLVGGGSGTVKSKTSETFTTTHGSFCAMEIIVRNGVNHAVAYNF